MDDAPGKPLEFLRIEVPPQLIRGGCDVSERKGSEYIVLKAVFSIGTTSETGMLLVIFAIELPYRKIRLISVLAAMDSVPGAFSVRELRGEVVR